MSLSTKYKRKSPFEHENKTSNSFTKYFENENSLCQCYGP